jgi:hypothetical protein
VVVFLVAKMERSAVSTSLSGLLVLFLTQFSVGMALNLFVTFPTNVFPASGGSLTATLNYILTGGDLFLTSHAVIDTAIVAVAVANLALVIHKSNVYKTLSTIGLILVLIALVNGERFVASNFSINGVSYGMAIPFIAAFTLYFVEAMLMYRDIAVQAKP